MADVLDKNFKTTVLETLKKIMCEQNPQGCPIG